MNKNYQLLTFTLGGEVYAMEVTTTREVLEFRGITPIPRMPNWIRGVLNLRGAVVPVLDLKLKLGMGQTEHTRDTCILILELVLEGDATVVGVLADSVKEVFEVESNQIEPSPRFGTKISTEYIRGLGHRNGALFIILDIQRIFTTDEFTLADETAHAAGVVALDVDQNAGNRSTAQMT